MSPNFQTSLSKLERLSPAKLDWIFRGSRSLVSRHVDHPYRTKSITFWHRYRPVISRAANLLSSRF